MVAFAVIGALLHALEPAIAASAVLAAGALLAALRVMPARGVDVDEMAAAPRWDLPARAIVATGLVLTLTGIAPLLGPRASGILSGFPLYATVLAVFAHRAIGSRPAAAVMHGLVAGLFGFASFFIVVATALVPLGPVLAFGLATVAVLCVQAISLTVLRRTG